MMFSYECELPVDLFLDRLDGLAGVHCDDLGRVLVHLLVLEAEDVGLGQHEPTPKKHTQHNDRKE